MQGQSRAQIRAQIRPQVQGRAPVFRPPAGFTMVELIVMMVLIGVLSAIGAARFFDRGAFDAAAYGEQLRAMMRYAQKLAIAQNRNVFVQGSLDGAALCYEAANPCPAGSLVPVPAGDNSGNDATRKYCLSGGAYASGWYCEGRPDGVAITPVSGSLAPFFFNALGRPCLAADLASNCQDSSFAGLTLALSGGGATASLSVSQETGYVE
jgi:MSHA pilin protein MshC